MTENNYQLPIETLQGECLCCGESTFFDSYIPKDFPCKRNSFYCRNCGSIARNRHIARTILSLFPTTPPSSSLKTFAHCTNISILNTCASMTIHTILKEAPKYIVSEYWDHVETGAYHSGIECQDLQNLTYKDNSFDLVITEDILEHVADPEKACLEIRRVLKPGGYHVATISVFWDQPKSITRAVLKNGVVCHLLPPSYHCDPNRPEGALVFVDFGSDIAEKYCSLTGKTTVLWSNGNQKDEQLYAIFHNMVFVSQK